MPETYPEIPGIQLTAICNHSANTVIYAGKQMGSNKRVAVKCTSYGCSKSRKSELKREGMLLNRLHHPNIVQGVSYGTTGQLVYMVMEYLRGEALEKWMCARDLDSDGCRSRYALDFMRQILDALQYLHQQNPPVIHNDISPSNIIVDAEQPRVVLIDFGVAVSRRATTPFTPGFAAIERMSNVAPHTAMDVYAAGALFKWMIEMDQGLLRRYGRLINDMMADNPEQRPAASACLRRLQHEGGSGCLWVFVGIGVGTVFAMVLVALLAFLW